MTTRLVQAVRFGLSLLILVLFTGQAWAAPYAAMVMDMRTGEVLYSKNAETQLYPASLTKMMTLYIAFEAIEHGEISLDTMVTVSRNAAAEPPSHLGLRRGQRIKLRYLIRAAAVKSANDAATAIGEAIGGSEDGFAARMNRTAAALGMKHTHFRNAHGLTLSGHLSTAHDMTILGRHLFFDYPQYYNLFSRRTANVGGREVPNTNTRFLNAYRGADGIKTGYTSAAGFNLVASAERDGKRIITTVFGGTSTLQRNRKVAELMDLGFRKAPMRVSLRQPARPPYLGPTSGNTVVVAANGAVPTGAAGKIIRVVVAPTSSIRPRQRPVAAPPEDLVAALDLGIDALIADVVETSAAPTAVAPEPAPAAATPPAFASIRPEPRPETEAAPVLASVEAALDTPAIVDTPSIVDTPAEADLSAEADITEEDLEAPVLAAPAIAVAVTEQAAVPTQSPTPTPAPRNLAADELILAAAEPGFDDAPQPTEVVTRVSTSGGHHWGINVGRYNTEFVAQRVLLKTALAELSTLGDALRKVARSSRGFEANFVGLTQEGAELACRRLEARDTSCKVLGPT